MNGNVQLLAVIAAGPFTPNAAEISAIGLLLALYSWVRWRSVRGRRQPPIWMSLFLFAIAMAAMAAVAMIADYLAARRVGF
jgi:drug/metabolite transporter (DMT)-like permease